jgi:ParB family chromosome partitioning protein
METPEHETASEPSEERTEPGSDSAPPSSEAAPPLPDAPMPSLPPRVEPPAAPPLDRPLDVEERLVPLETLDQDTSFRLRAEGEVGRLAMDLARLGQAFPIEVRQREGTDRLQILTGFRRVAALRFLQRTQVLARVHSRLSDEDALLVSLADVLHGSALTTEEAGQLERRLDAEGRLSAAARDMLARAQAPDDGLAPETVGPGEEEVDADELAASLAVQLAELNQDLAVLAPIFEALDPGRRAELLEQLRYAAELVAYFEKEP